MLIEIPEFNGIMSTIGQTAAFVFKVLVFHNSH